MSRRFSKLGWIALAALLIVGLIALPACTAAPTEQEEEEEEEEEVTIPFRNPDTFVYQSIAEPDTLDPAWCYDTSSGTQIGWIYETLVKYDREKVDEFLPSLATAWDFDADTLTYTFTIRQGVKFHNGNDLTPSDVEYSFERAMVMDRPSGPSWMFLQPLLGAWHIDDVTFAEMDAAVEVDGDSVVIQLAHAAWELPFLQILVGQWASIVDKEWCTAQGDWDGTEATYADFMHPQDEGDTALFDETNGTGMWELDVWEKGSQIKVKRFDDYWGDPAPFGYIIYQLVEEWTSRKLALLAGDADSVDVPRAYISELEGIDDIQLYKDLAGPRVDAFYFNMCIGEESGYIGSGALDGEGIPGDFFQDVDVRQGMAYAFDYDTYLKDALEGEGKFLGGPVPEGFYGYNPNASKYTYDLDKATEHLQAAWGGELWEKGCKFTLLYNAGNLARKTMCELMAEGMFLVNDKFQVSILPIAWGSYVDHLYDFTLPMFSIGWLADYPHADNFIVPFMHSVAGTFSYFQCYGTPEIDDLITEAFEEPNPAQQLQDYYDLQQLYFDDAPGMVLVQPLGRRYMTKYISGFYFNPVISPALPLWDMGKSES